LAFTVAAFWNLFNIDEVLAVGDAEFKEDHWEDAGYFKGRC
jgi:ABC-type polysaccharide/polyol phosphate transport system ATPase subunit